MNSNLSNKVQSELKIEDLINITNKRKIIYPSFEEKKDINYEENATYNKYEGNSKREKNVSNKIIEDENTKINIMKCLKISNTLKKKHNKVNMKKTKKIIDNNRNERNNYYINHKTNLFKNNNVFLINNFIFIKKVYCSFFHPNSNFIMEKVYFIFLVFLF
jgi:hypothetical protein